MAKVIAITGASAGIGRATALRLGRAGASVAICAKRRERLEDVALAIEQAGGRGLPVVADVTSDQDMQRFVAVAVSSIVGKRGIPYLGGYSATKFAQVGLYRLSRALTLLNALAPGFCDRVVKRWGREPIHV